MEIQLYNPDKKKIWKGTLEENTLITETGKPDGKMRRTEKSFKDFDTASKTLQKKTWDKLKQGFIYHNPKATSAEAYLHYFIASAYTGALVVEKVKDTVLVVKHGDGFKESLLFLDKSGQMIKEIAAPKGMVQEVLYSEKYDCLFLIVDHKIYKLDLKTEKYKLLKAYQKAPASFISLSPNQQYLAWGSSPAIGV